MPPGSSQGAIQRGLRIALAVVVVAEAVDDARVLRRRIRRATTTWWSRVDHRDTRRLHEAELGYLLKHLHTLSR